MARYKDIELLDCMILSEKSDEFCEGVRFTMEEVDKLPTADVVEVKHGEWIEDFAISTEVGLIGEPIKVFKCSLCGRYESYKEPYCNCGAKMDGGKGEIHNYVNT